MSIFELPFIVIGHRGAAALAPENTLPSFQRALDLGVPWVELDVYHLEQNLVVIHDDTLERTTNGRGAVMDSNLASLRNLDAGDGATIPLLTEVLELVAAQGRGQVGVNIELKGPGTAQPVAELIATATATKNGHPLPPLLVSSFDHQQLRDFRARDSTTPVSPLFHKRGGDPVAVARALNAWSVNLSGRIVDQATVAAAHAAGMRVLVYTINTVAQARALRAMGVDGVFTDRPDLLLADLAAGD